LDFVDTAFGTERLDVEIAEVAVAPSSALEVQTLGCPAIRQQAGVIVLGLKPADGAMKFNPPPDTVIRAGDCLIVIAGDAALKRLEALAKSPQPSD
ncbi:MAG: cation:proton antiporter regulatory subunit, partial [Terriglobales bacterium]